MKMSGVFFYLAAQGDAIFILNHLNPIAHLPACLVGSNVYPASRRRQTDTSPAPNGMGIRSWCIGFSRFSALEDRLKAIHQPVESQSRPCPRDIWPILLGLLLLAIIGCGPATLERSAIDRSHANSADATGTNSDPNAVNDDVVQVTRVEAFCSGCHALPKPSSFSQDHWPREVERGYEFYFASGRHDLLTPNTAAANDYFVTRSPHSLAFPQPLPVDQEACQRFRLVHPSYPNETASAAAGAAIELFQWKPPIGAMLMMSDMRSGDILASGFDGTEMQPCEVVANLKHPSRMAQVDLDNNGQLGLLVAELGSFLPADHSLGQVVWLRQTSDTQLRFEKVVLLRGCGRVADAQAADLDGDGDLDISVADFGWHETGRLLWLERVTDGPVDSNSFVTHVIDERSGGLQVPLYDLNGDGNLDIIALIAQETEAIIAFLNNGAGGFKATVLYAANDPSFGSSGIDLCDFDNDGDMDILYSNGDSFDRYEVKPYHGVRWLENLGELQFKEHLVATLPGVHRAIPTDLDCDGDMDLVASAFLPGHLVSMFEGQDPMALVWIENMGQQQFRIRPLQVGTCKHAAICIADINEDGLPDIAAANFYEDAALKMPPMDILIAQ